MPRKSRIDAPGALHHVIVRGINRERIFNDDPDRFRFLERLGALIKKGKNRNLVKARSLLCYWAVRELDISMTALARRLNLSITAVSNAVSRGENLAKTSG